MSATDKIENAAQEIRGKVKETAAKVSGKKLMLSLFNQQPSIC